MCHLKLKNTFYWMMVLDHLLRNHKTTPVNLEKHKKMSGRYRFITFITVVDYDLASVFSLAIELDS